MRGGRRGRERLERRKRESKTRGEERGVLQNRSPAGAPPALHANPQKGVEHETTTKRQHNRGEVEEGRGGEGRGRKWGGMAEVGKREKGSRGEREDRERGREGRTKAEEGEDCRAETR